MTSFLGKENGLTSVHEAVAGCHQYTVDDVAGVGRAVGGDVLGKLVGTENLGDDHALVVLAVAIVLAVAVLPTAGNNSTHNNEKFKN